MLKPIEICIKNFPQPISKHTHIFGSEAVPELEHPTEVVEARRKPPRQAPP
jgi:hypothetical protein